MDRAGLPETTTVGLVTGGHFLSHFYLLTLPPLFPLLRTEFALSNARLGLLVSMISIAMLLQLFVGELVDRIGAKRVFVTGIGLTAAGILLAGLAPSYLALLAFAALSGIGQSTFHPADYPLIEVVSDTDRIGRNFSIHTFGGYAGFAAAPLIVGSLGLTYGWRTALIAVGAVGIAYAAISAVALQPVYQTTAEHGPTPTARTPPGRAALLSPGIIVMSVFFIVFSMAGKGVQTFTPILAVDGFHLAETIGNTALSVFFAITAITVLIGGLLADRYAPHRIIAVTTTLAAITLLLTVADVIPIDAIAFIVLFALAGGAYGLVFASRDRLVSAYSAAGTTGRSFGLVFTASSLGSLTSPILLGWVIDRTTAALAFGFIAAFFFLSGLVVVIGRAPTPLGLRLPSQSK